MHSHMGNYLCFFSPICSRIVMHRCSDIFYASEQLNSFDQSGSTHLNLFIQKMSCCSSDIEQQCIGSQFYSIDYSIKNDIWLQWIMYYKGILAMKWAWNEFTAWFPNCNMWTDFPHTNKDVLNHTHSKLPHSQQNTCVVVVSLTGKQCLFFFFFFPRLHELPYLNLKHNIALNEKKGIRAVLQDWL